MLPEIAAEALRFLSRRDLDKASTVSKWLDAMIAQCFEAYPLRRVRRIALRQWMDSTLKVLIDYSGTDHTFSTTDDAVHFAASLLRNSYVERLELGSAVLRIDEMDNSKTLFARHWTTLLDAIRSGAVRDLEFRGIDFSALSDDAFLIAVGSRGLQSLLVRKSVIPRGYFIGNRGAIPDGPSDAAILDFCFPADTARGGQWRSLVVEDSRVTDLFLTKFFEYLAPGSVDRMEAYRFPPTNNDDKPYKVVLYESHFTDVRFGPWSYF